MNKLVFIGLGILAIISVIYVFKNQQNMQIDSFEECVAAGNPVMESYPRQCRADNKTFVEEISATPIPIPITSQSGNIVVTFPVASQIVDKSIQITGQARVFENAFSYRVVDANGNKLMEDYSMADAPDIGQFGPFSVTAQIENPQTPTGFVEVFAYSAKDGSEIDKVRVPVIFSNE